MASNIDPQYPVYAVPTTLSVRTNFNADQSDAEYTAVRIEMGEPNARTGRRALYLAE
jgi:hypothetical protein